LFTVKSFRRLASYHGFNVEQVLGFGVPLTDLMSGFFLAKPLEVISHALARCLPGLFAYQVILVCRRPLSHLELMGKTFEATPPS
jgi:hypothetical protein